MNKGFTLVELLIVVGILSIVITGMLKLFIYTTLLSDLTEEKTLALTAAQNKIEEIREYNYDDIVTDYASGGTVGNTFDPADLNGKGVVTIDATNPSLLDIDVVVCWEGRDGRIYGEDSDLDGVLDSGEDLNGNGKIDSIVSLETMLAER